MNKNSSNLKTIRTREGKLYGEGCMGWEFEFLFYGNVNKREKEKSFDNRRLQHETKNIFRKKCSLSCKLLFFAIQMRRKILAEMFSGRLSEARGLCNLRHKSFSDARH